MSYAPQYNPTVSFANEESAQVSGRSTVRTVAVDTELANVSTSLNGINSNLQKLQRDDNKLLDGIVEPYALAEQTRALLAAKGMPRGYWAPNTDYAIGDSVVFGNTSYLCFVAHVSTVTFDTGKFMAISGDGSSFNSAQQAAASATQAQGFASSASASSTSASSSASSATASATSASNSAGSASSSASAAAASAAAAANLISSSVEPASQAEAEAGTNNTKFMSPLRVSQAIGTREKGNIQSLSLTTSGNFTTPANISASTIFKLTLVGGGAGGGGSNGGNACGGGGGAGGAVEIYISGLAPSTAYAVVIGAGGGAGSSAGGNGGTGGDTSITIGAVTYTAGGGGPGLGTTTAAIGRTSNQGGISASIISSTFKYTQFFQTNYHGFSSNPTFCGCNGAGLLFGTNGFGGATGTAAGTSAIGYGAGGGGGVSSSGSGGAGAPGKFIAEWVA